MKLDASRASNEELRKANEELRRYLQRLEERSMEEWSPMMEESARPMPFSQAIMDAVVPNNFMMPKIVFTSTEDPRGPPHFNA